MAWARLLRLSNAPTAIADILAGAAVATGVAASGMATLMLAAISLCLYHGGMAFNDARDAEADAEEDRGRPIASGSISRPAAFRLAWTLLLAGVAIAVVLGVREENPTPPVIAASIAVLVVLYNSPLKRTAVGPAIMGGCRALNVMLGASFALTTGLAAQLAPGAFAYVAGLTLFARDESVGGQRRQLIAGAGISFLGLLWLALSPWFMPVGRWPQAALPAWWLLWAVTACYVFRGAAAAVLQPTPKRVGRAVGLGIQGIVLIDAALAAGYAGPYAGLSVLVCLPVAMLLARWIPPT